MLYITGDRFNGIRVTWVTRRPDVVSRISRIHVRGRGRRTLCSLLSLKKEVTVLAEAKGTRRVTNRHAIACGSNACASARCGRQAALLALRSRTHSPRACAKRMRARRRGRSVAECSRRSALLMLPPSGVRMLPQAQRAKSSRVQSSQVRGPCSAMRSCRVTSCQVESSVCAQTRLRGSPSAYRTDASVLATGTLVAAW